MNPWKQTALLLMRDILRFALWLCVVVIGLMVAVFSICFTYQLLTHLWQWCMRVMFGSDW